MAIHFLEFFYADSTWCFYGIFCSYSFEKSATIFRYMLYARERDM